MTKGSRDQLPEWASRAMPHARGAAQIGRHVLCAGLYVSGVAVLMAMLVVMGWLVVGLIEGFVSQATLFGNGAAGGVIALFVTIGRVLYRSHPRMEL